MNENSDPYVTIGELAREVTRLRRYIATFPARPWLETDHPGVVACMGSDPECARWGCQAENIRKVLRP